MNSYVDFKVTTHSDSADHFFVRRRFRDFQWLREQLVAVFPGAIVPPLPQVDSMYGIKDDRFSSAFIQQRRAGLELFLQRVAGHPSLSTCASLQTFLEAKVWELQTAKNVSSSSSAASWTLLSTLLYDSTDASLKRVGLRQVRRVRMRTCARLKQFSVAKSESYGVPTASHQHAT